MKAALEPSWSVEWWRVSTELRAERRRMKGDGGPGRERREGAREEKGEYEPGATIVHPF
jgi:hypothetical protein